MWLGDMPMPEEATDEMMMAAAHAIEEMERKDEAIEGITFFTEILERDKKKLAEAEGYGDTEACDTLNSIMKTTNEIIDKYRSWLQ